MRRLIFILCFSLLPFSLQAQYDTNDPVGRVIGRAVGVAAESMANDGFTSEQKRAIDDYFRTSRADDKEGQRAEKRSRDTLPPGLAKKGRLPPGLAKRDTLPPGLAKRDLPNDLESRLGQLPWGRERSIVGDDIVLIDTATNVILDILKGAARR
ncbi:LWamide neuropeptides [Rhodospirillaceae bacterium LM-1]|nr:LWamide neuropeptides [Rhodospirillaceae bacterium LM-1]